MDDALRKFFKIIAFTGHRPGHVGVPGFDYLDAVDGYWNRAAGWKALENVIYNRLLNTISQANGQPIKVIQGGALGTDMIAGLAASRLKKEGYPIQMEMAEPFKNQGSKWSNLAKTQLQYLENQSDKVTDVSNMFNPTDMYHMYKNRNEYMVDNADELWSFMNPEMSSGRLNGTEGTIKYAQNENKAVRDLFLETMKALNSDKVEQLKLFK